MSEHLMPELTLDPKAAEAVPTLTLEPELDTPATPAPVAAEPAKPEAEPVKLDDSMLTDAEKKVVEDFSKKIDIMDSNLVLQYGAAAQKNVAGFSENALSSVRTKDLGEIGESLSELVVELKGFGAEEEKKGLLGIFKKAGNKLESMKAEYSKVEANVDRISRELEQHQVVLMKDVAMFDRMYDKNAAYFRQLTLYIIAGQEKLDRVRQGELAALYEKAAQSGDAMDAQAANDLAAQCDRFEKKINDLMLTRHVALQTAPQIRLLQNNDSLLVERIQSTIANTLPLWKNQMVLGLGLHNSQQALKAQQAVTDMTNELLKKNSETLKMGTVGTAKEAERGIIDLETLVQTNQDLIDTINEVITIQENGRKARREAEHALVAMEQELKQKLLETNLG